MVLVLVVVVVVVVVAVVWWWWWWWWWQWGGGVPYLHEYRNSSELTQYTSSFLTFDAFSIFYPVNSNIID
jgi:hypothetical protein